MDEKFIRFIIVALFAFVAQLIDGGIGMGYGVSLTSLFLSIGVGTAMASATVHISEIVTTFFSGASHVSAGNFDKKVFLYLTAPGIVGGVVGAYVATTFQNVPFIKPLIAMGLLVLGLLIIVKYTVKKDVLESEYSVPRIRHLLPLGFVAAFIDAIGGGGWGPISTPALIVGNTNPKNTIGSVNAAEFFVTLAISMTFLLNLPKIDLGLIVPTIVGGVIAAPIAATITKRLPHKTVAIAAGCLIILLSLRTLIKAVV